MGKVMKFVVVLGALAGIVGAFLPFTKTGDEVAKIASAVATRFGGEGGLFGSAKGSLWDVAQLGGSAAGIVYGLLGALALSAIFAGFGMLKRYGRGLALGSLITAAAPAGLMVLAFTEAGSRGGAGNGLILTLAGSCLALLGALLAVLKPEAVKA